MMRARGNSSAIKTEMAAIQRRLVGDALGAVAHGAKPLEIDPGGLVHDGRSERANAIGITRLRCKRLGQIVGDSRDVVELPGAGDLGMAGQDLLDERGARARHADDEHRKLRGAVGAGQVFHRNAGKTGDERIETGALIPFVIHGRAKPLPAR